ncbi:MAG TPA: metallophosphoesterase [Rhizomicrobium sp.]|nr:metallophosphoesterase [Rhizomicrobium sp.]
MTTRAHLLAALLLLIPAAAVAQDNVSAWVQYAPGGGADARVLTLAPECPRLSIDGAQQAMAERAAPDADFGLRVCSLAIPRGAKHVEIAGPRDRTAGGQQPRERLPVPPAHPRRIMVFGDTGCRIKIMDGDRELQACNDPKQWPFPQIAAEAAKLKPDLVIHVGDYLYRESACPQGNAGCAGSPWGDNWASWDADFFTPAAPLLKVAPWVIVRGNHEDCARAGPGFLRLLGPLPYDPNAKCIDHLAPYMVALGPVNAVVMDNASAPDTTIDHDRLSSYQSDFASLPSLAKAPAWLVMHRPIWGAIKGPGGVPLGGNATMIAALGDSHALDGVALMLAGHIHTFEAMNYSSGAPAIVAGFGGDNLDVTPRDLSGANLSGKYVEDGLSIGGFGFLIMEQQGPGWRIDVHGVDGRIERVCKFENGRVGCAKSGTATGG